MKIAIMVLMTLVPLLVSAQGSAGGSSQQMQEMMKKAQQMQACMQSIDQGQMKSIQQKGQQMAVEIKALCAAGKRSSALAKVMSYGQEMTTNPIIQEMKRCGEIMKGFVPDMMKMAEPYLTEKSGVHICDE